MADLIKNGMHGCSAAENYVPPKDELLRERLEWFQDQKLALMMHFGPYAQMGICESWPLSEEDASWSRRDVDWEDDPKVFREQYVNLNRSFNPMRFVPEQWADVGARDGFKYFLLTTKHHDGFCMFDTKYTDYKITDPSCPFHTHKYANVVKHAFDAFRARGIAIAAYFSKPDWHCPWYWAEGMERPVGSWRNPTYDPKEHPDVWEKYVEFTHNQIMELVGGDYGRIDILWLDGGQVDPKNNQDIRLSEVLARARKIQPWLLSADRTIGGENENYITPEQSVPSDYVPVPWESCVTVGTGFAYKYGDTYKSPRELVSLLISVVCRGGNLALNVAPQPDGRLPKRAIESVDGMGAWLKANGEAIYSTRAYAPYDLGGFAYTQRASEGKVYAMYHMDEGEKLGRTLVIPFNQESKRVTLLDCGEVAFKYVELTGDEYAAAGITRGIEVTLPYQLNGTCPIAPTFRIEV